MISIEDFSKIELKTAEVISAERVIGSDKLIKINVKVGDKNRQIVAGIGKKYDPESIIGKIIIIVANLEPKKLMGLESDGMLLVAKDDNGNVSLLTIMDEMSHGNNIG